MGVPVPSGASSQPAQPLSLRPLQPEDEQPAIGLHRQLRAEGFEFLLGWTPRQSWDAYLERLEREHLGIDLGPDRVPATLLAVDIGAGIVGRVSIRHRLNAYLERYGGHIGYAIAPAWRRRGLATAALHAAIERSLSLVEGKEILLTCAEDNVASAAVITRCGGIYLDHQRDPFTNTVLRRYMIAMRQRAASACD